MTDICPICLEEMTDDHPNGIKTEIHDKHFAHYNCICKWMHTNAICPVCRTKVNPNKICIEKERADQAKKQFESMLLSNDLKMVDFTPQELDTIDKLQETYNRWYNTGGKNTGGGKKRRKRLKTKCRQPKKCRETKKCRKQNDSINSRKLKGK